MIDQNGNRIDLNSIDAIGELPEGGFDVWLSDGTRVITYAAHAADVWRDYIRSKVEVNNLRILISLPLLDSEISWRTGMNKAEKKKFAQDIVDQLLSQDAESARYFVTGNREEYDFLLDAALKGVIENVNLNRSGIWINRKRIVPPESYFVQLDARNLHGFAAEQ